MASGKEIDHLINLFSDLREKALKSGAGVETVRSEFLRDVKQSRKSSYKLLILVLIPLVLSVGSYYLYNHLIENWDEEPCLLNMNEVVGEVTRKLTDCALMCGGLTEIPRATNLSRDEFVSKYAYSSRPVVVEDGGRNWSALTTFNFTYFQRIYKKNKDALRINEDECQFFPYNTEFATLEEVFEMSKERAEWKGEPWYIGWSNCDPDVRQQLRRHYKLPYFLPTLSETSEQDWIFMGGPGPGALIHIDSVNRPSWQVQLSGQKKWTLIPPAECEHMCHSLSTVLHKGEAIVVDTNQWFHSTQVLPAAVGELSISIGAEYD